MTNPFEKFSNHYKKSLKTAAELAIELNHVSIDPQHILYGLTSLPIRTLLPSGRNIRKNKGVSISSLFLAKRRIF